MSSEGTDNGGRRELHFPRDRSYGTLRWQGGSAETRGAVAVPIGARVGLRVDRDADLSPLATLTATALDRLDLSNTAITDAGLALLAPLTQLRELNLSGTAVTNAGLVALKTVCPYM